jgi:hypothetical protein
LAGKPAAEAELQTQRRLAARNTGRSTKATALVRRLGRSMESRVQDDVNAVKLI